jgi:transposase
MERDDEVHLFCVSDGRKAKDRAIREKQEKRFLKDLENLAQRIKTGGLCKPDRIHEKIGRLKERYPRVARYWKVFYDNAAKSLSWTVDAQKRQTAQKLDGSYLLKTNRKDLPEEEIWRTYSLLTRAENAFRCMKSPLAERPIFHQLKHRVETHIFLCVLAYHILAAIEKKLQDQGIHTSWATVRQILSTHHIMTTALPMSGGGTLRIRRDSVPDPQVREIYKLLGVPPRIMDPITTVSPTLNTKI